MLASKEYSSYYKVYVEKVKGTNLVESLALGLQATATFFTTMPTAKLDYRYAEGKWTPKEILLHIIDTERVFIYRALQFARAENVVLAGFDQDEFAANVDVSNRSIEDLLEEFTVVRKASIQFYKTCNDAALLRMGVASDSPLSVRAAGFIICGHEIHHCEIIKERYL